MTQDTRARHMLNHRSGQQKEITGHRRMLLTIYMWGNGLSCYLHLCMKSKVLNAPRKSSWSWNARFGVNKLAGEGNEYLEDFE